MRISDWSSDLCSSDLVKLTRDGVPIVLHDDEVDRTTDGSGLVRDMSFAEIRRLDAGVRFDPAFRGGQVPALEETLETCLRLGRSEERSVGKEGGSTCGSRWWRYNLEKKTENKE